MTMSRREFAALGAAGLAGSMLPLDMLLAAAADGKGLRMSACDWSIGARGQLKGLDTAKSIGLEGIEVSANSGKLGKILTLADPAVRKQYKDKSKETGIIISSTAMGLLNGSPLATDDRAPGWLDQTIEATGDLGAKVMLMAFFGKGNLRKGSELKKKEVDTVVARLKEAAPKAKECGVIMGIESTLSGKHNMEILDRVNHDSVQCYYDIGNSTRNGFDVPAEIRSLGDRICQIHFKDHGGWLDSKVKLGPVAEAISAIKYKGWIVLETGRPTGKLVPDFQKNAEIARKALGM